jgi:glycosyltransferase involved in cell wall biosynthesis
MSEITTDEPSYEETLARARESLPAGDRVAFVFDHWYTPGGAQNEVLALMELFPEAPLFTLMHDRNAEWDPRKTMHVSFLDRLPLAHSRPNLYLPLTPAAIESFDFRDFDLVISVTGTWAKGIIVPPHTRHVCRAWVPMRYGWENRHDYMTNGLRGERSHWLAKRLRGYVMSYMRLWDVVSANRVDQFVAGSRYVADVIRRRYRRESVVVYPPVDTDYFTPSGDPPSDYYLLVSRLTPYKRVDLAVDAFNRLGLPLKIVGSGSERRSLHRAARRNIEFLGKLDYEDRGLLRDLLRGCRGFIMPQVEDFGIAPVEAMACGRPVVAYAAGGALETVVPGMTGVLFGPQEGDALVEAVEACSAHTLDPESIRSHAEQFSRARFQKEMMAFVTRRLNEQEDPSWQGARPAEDAP